MKFPVGAALLAAITLSGCMGPEGNPDRQPYANAVELRVTDPGAGYYVAGRDGAVFAFGDADKRRERPAGAPDAVVDVAFRTTGARPAATAPSLTIR